MSISLFFTQASQWRIVRALRTGPLAGYTDGFAAWLFEQGYARLSGCDKLRLIDALNRWLEERNLKLSALDDAHYQVFLHETGIGQKHAAVTGRQFISWLQSNKLLNVAEVASDADQDLATQVEKRYERFLHDDRGLSKNTVKKYLSAAHAFFGERFQDSPIGSEDLES